MIKIISIIGFSGSGKTRFILNAIKLLKKHLNYNTAVIKNIHEHQIDKAGKDSYEYSQAGAFFSITKNVINETAIFIRKEINIEQIAEWLSNSPFKINLIFLEGFRNSSYPTALCLKELEELKIQLDENVRMISGVICSKENRENSDLKIPIIDIKNNFNEFLEIFEIK